MSHICSSMRIAICSWINAALKSRSMAKVVLESYYQLADSDSCVAESRGGLLHELFHVFGVIIVTFLIILTLIILSHRQFYHKSPTQ